MPALFVGHGNPLHAIGNNAWTRAWAALGAALPRPRAVLAVSAHWYLEETAVTAMEMPRTIHDFGGFPDELYRVRYPAPGEPALAKQVAELLGPTPVRLDGGWGLDHGTWSVLRHIHAKADVPVVQLAMDATEPPGFHYGLGRRLAPLRDEGVLLFGSGNLVHNLHAYAWGGRAVEPFPWAVRFERLVRARIAEDREEAVVDYESLGPDALLAVPTPDHYLPLLYVLGARRPGETAAFPVEGIDGGSVSMLAVRIG